MNRLVQRLRQSVIRQNVAISVLIVVACLALYRSNGDTYIYTFDSAPNSLWTFNVLEHHELEFDDFRTSYFQGFGASYIFVPGRAGQITSFFPIGTALLSALLYAAFDAQLHAKHQPVDITSVDFERVRVHYEKLAAMSLAALAAVMMFLCARQIGGLTRALIVTVFFAAGTEMWTIGSQALWQHGPVNLVVLTMTCALLAATRARGRSLGWWLFFAGVCAGFLPVVRPTAALFLVAAFAFTVWEFRRSSWPFAVGTAIGLAPGALWNEYSFGTLIGGYGGLGPRYVVTLAQFAESLVGLLISPGKGLFVFTPLFVFSVAGVWYAARARTAPARLVLALTAAAAVLILQYSFFTGWWGGASFGARYLTDIAGIGALLLIYVLPEKPFEFWRGSLARTVVSAAFVVLLFASVGVQFAGANGEEESQWSGIPVDIDIDPARVWIVNDSQVQRDAAATFRKFQRNRLDVPQYLAHVAFAPTSVREAGMEPARVLTASAGEPIALVATLQNRGSSRLYGYRSGYWNGQARVRVDVSGPASAAAILFVPDTIAQGETAYALGRVVAPAVPGTYRLTLTPFLNRIPDFHPNDTEKLVIPLQVR